MFLKLVCFGSKIYIESIRIGFKAIHHFKSRKNLAPSTPTPHFTSLDESFSKSLAGFQKVKVLKY